MEDLLLERGLGPKDLADATGVARSTLWRWLRGTAQPRIPQIHALAKALRTDLETVAAALRLAQRRAMRAR